MGKDGAGGRLWQAARRALRFSSQGDEETTSNGAREGKVQVSVARYLDPDVCRSVIGGGEKCRILLPGSGGPRLTVLTARA